jgi:DNA-binding XRE family transcriptional regulator
MSEASSDLRRLAEMILDDVQLDEDNVGVFDYTPTIICLRAALDEFCSAHGYDGRVSPAETIGWLRREAGLSQRQLAKKVGVSLRTITSWERTGGPLTKVVRLATALGVPFGSLDSIEE